jgi:hypothetical protein
LRRSTGRERRRCNRRRSRRLATAQQTTNPANERPAGSLSSSTNSAAIAARQDLPGARSPTPESNQSLTRVWPESDQSLTRVWPESGPNLARTWPEPGPTRSLARTVTKTCKERSEERNRVLPTPGVSAPSCRSSGPRSLRTRFQRRCSDQPRLLENCMTCWRNHVQPASSSFRRCQISASEIGASSTGTS